MRRSKDNTFNILHVVSKLPVGGVETMILNEIRGYNSSRYETSICCLMEGGEIADALIEEGYDVSILNKLQGHGFDFGAVATLYKLMRRKKIHILRTHQYHANLYGRIAGTLARVPIKISSFQNVYNFPEKRKFHRSILNYILSFCSDALVACSRSVADDIIKYDKVTSEKIKVIYNGVSNMAFKCSLTKQEARQVFNLPDDAMLIGSVGRLDQQKGHEILIHAASDLKNSQVIIAGGGPLLNELKDLADSLHVNVKFLGMISPEKVPVFMKALDIFCFPSLWEGFGIAVAEAMAAGLPVVASDIPPLREVVDEAGMLVAPANVEELAKAFVMLVDNPGMRAALAEKAEERAGMFSIEKSVKSFEKLFEDTLLQRGLLQ